MHLIRNPLYNRDNITFFVNYIGLPMHNLQALIQGKISPQSINIDELVELAKKYQQENSAEYKLIELAVNIVLAKHLEKAQKFL